VEYGWLWRAWVRLSRDRPRHGGGFSAPVPGYIPWTTIIAWAEKHRLDDDETTFLDEVLNSLSDFDLKWTIDRQKEKPEK